MHKLLMGALFAVVLLGSNEQASAQSYCPGKSPDVFIDVLATDPFCPQITWLAVHGITLGCSIVAPGQLVFCPAQYVPREQMAAFLQRLAYDLFPIDCAVGSVMAWNGADWVCTLVTGPAGPAGPPGATGATGQSGASGATGASGASGCVGSPRRRH